MTDDACRTIERLNRERDDAVIEAREAKARTLENLALVRRRDVPSSWPIRELEDVAVWLRSLHGGGKEGA